MRMRLSTAFWASLVIVAGIPRLEARPPVTDPPPVPGHAAGTNALGPRIQFATPIRDFGKVRSGDPVRYTYYFTNTGDALLEVRAVQPSCGCTTAGQWTRQVKPGDSGEIPIQFNSSHFNGPVFKTITVSSNAKEQPNSVLQLKGTVWKPIELSPPYTVLTVLPDAATASAKVRIVNNMTEPLQLWDPASSNPDFTAVLKTNTPGKEYQLTISARPPLHSGNIAAKVTLKTSSHDPAELEVPFWANVQPAVLVMPPQIMLPRPPLMARATPSITIQNNSTNRLTLSDPVVNVPGVEVQIKEIQPGRVFTVAMEFPQGYENPTGQPAELSIKSSNPHFPLIKVPIHQMPKQFTPPYPVFSPHPSQPAPPVPLKPTAQLSR
jgi:Protein of unknown function (DUF1573)